MRAQTSDAGVVRVMHLVYAFRPGGMEHGVLKIVNGLDPARATSAICSTTPADPKLCQMVSARVPVISLNRRKGNDPGVVWSIYRVLKRERPHILHTHSWGTLVEGIVAGRMAGVPLVVHGEHGTLQLRPHQVRVQRWAWSHADHLLSVSSRLAERMSRDVGIARDRIQVIRNGVNLARFAGSRVSSAKARFGLPRDAVVVGTVGRLVEVKDHATLVDAVQALLSRGRQVHAIIAGDGPLRGELEARIASLGLEGTVHLLGHQTDVESVFAAMDVFVLPSKSEGMSNTILEAMASGLPVVATNVGGADEMVVDGETGILVPPGDPGALVDALDHVVADESLREAMGGAGRNRALGEFSLDRMIAGYQAFYCSVMPRAAARTRETAAV